MAADFRKQQNHYFTFNDPYKNLQVGWNAETHESYAYLAQLKDKVAKGEIRVISIDPVVTKTQQYLGCEQLYVNPQTDVALMLGIANEMVAKTYMIKPSSTAIALGLIASYLTFKVKPTASKNPRMGGRYYRRIGRNHSRSR